ncbi:MAG TPA: hypothetical protein VFY84_19130, partial [Jiangellales bacterium]|nr:hypothetical protein [Jiangellales bacterium]
VVLLACVSGLAVCAVLAAERLGQPALMWAGAVAFGASGIAANVVVMLALVRFTARQAVGTASGIVAVGLYLGFAVGPLIFGLVVDRVGSYTDAWLVVVTAYVVAAGVALLSGGRPGGRGAGRAAVGVGATFSTTRSTTRHAIEVRKDIDAHP